MADSNESEYTRLERLDNPSGQTFLFPQPQYAFDYWVGRRYFDELGHGEWVCHFCPECVSWWGCQADPCDTPRIMACWACIQVFDSDEMPPEWTDSEEGCEDDYEEDYEDDIWLD